jgi:hypothetical protein
MKQTQATEIQEVYHHAVSSPMKNGVERIKNNYTYVRTTPSNERADASHHHEQRNTVDSAVSHAQQPQLQALNHVQRRSSLRHCK